MAARQREKKRAVDAPVARQQAPTPAANVPQAVPTWLGMAAAGLVGVIYLTIASGGTFHFRQSPFPHHVLVADAWLHGQLNVRDEIIAERDANFYRSYRAEVERQFAAKGQPLNEAQWAQLRGRVKPLSEHDWSIVGGKYYGYWPPMVSLLLLPYVAVAGLQASDMLFSCLIGTGTVFLIFLMIREASRRGLVPVEARTCAALTLLFGLGTVHFYLTVAGQVWFLSQVVATFFITLAIWLVLQTEAGWVLPAVAGAAFGAAFLARNSVLVMAPFYYLTLFALSTRRPGHTWQSLFLAVVAFSVPLMLAIAINLEFNYLRFGSPFETSQELVVGGDPHFKSDYLHYGMFSLRYLPRNVYYYLLNPLLQRHRATHAITFDPWGNSMFLVTPALLYIFRSGRRRDWFTIALWVGVGALFALLLLFVATGWYQFGNRYILELLPMAVLLIASGMNGRLTRIGMALIALSIAVNAWGMYRFAAEQF